VNTLVLAALSAGLATASTLTYTDFSTVAGLTLNGDATQIGNALRLVRTSERGGLQSERLLTIRTSLRGSPTIPSRSCFNVYLNTTSSQPLGPVMSRTWIWQARSEPPTCSSGSAQEPVARLATTIF